MRNWDLKKLRDIELCRGYRNTFGLPSRGQRTSSNAKTKALLFRTKTKKRKKWNKIDDKKILLKKFSKVNLLGFKIYKKSWQKYFYIKKNKIFF